MSSADFTIYTPGIGTLSYMVSSPLGENSAHFLQLMPFTFFQFFGPPGTHHCWVGRGSMEWEVCPTLVHMMTSNRNQTPDFLILSPRPYPFGHMLPSSSCQNELFSQSWCRTPESLPSLSVLHYFHASRSFFATPYEWSSPKNCFVQSHLIQEEISTFQQIVPLRIQH